MNADLEQNVEVFARMQASGLDVDGPLQWGYFFTDKSRESLDEIQAELIVQGFRHEGSHQADDGTWVLQVSRVESLYKHVDDRSAKLANLAVELWPTP